VGSAVVVESADRSAEASAGRTRVGLRVVQLREPSAERVGLRVVQLAEPSAERVVGDLNHCN